MTTAAAVAVYWLEPGAADRHVACRRAGDPDSGGMADVRSRTVCRSPAARPERGHGGPGPVAAIPGLVRPGPGIVPAPAGGDDAGDGHPGRLPVGARGAAAGL